MNGLPPAVELVDLTRHFGQGNTLVRAVDGANLTVSRGEIVLIQGPSGSGKTTLLAMCAAMLRPTSGRVLLDGRDVTALTERELPAVRLGQIGFIFQSANLLANLTATENVRIVIEATGVRGRAAREHARDLLDHLGLADRADALPDALSGGERQRVAVARALANDAPLILADEPTANLDSRAGYQLMHTLELLAREQGRTVVAVTHDHRIEDVADRVLWLEDGHLGDRPPQEADLAVDPVCGMRIDRSRAAGRRSSPSGEVVFCSDICLDRFDADPSKFASRPQRADP